MKTVGNAQLVVRVLLSGESVTSSEIADKIRESEGKNVKPQDVSSILSRISNPEKSNFGFFIKRRQKGRSFYYKMPKEALMLAENQAYGLTLKTGPDKFTLDEVKEQFPELVKYIKPGKKTVKPRKKRSPAKVPQTSPILENKTPMPDEKPEEKAEVKPPMPDEKTDEKPEDKQEVFAGSQDNFDDLLDGVPVAEILQNVLKKLTDSQDMNVNVNVTIKMEK